MIAKKDPVKNIESYISVHPQQVRVLLKGLRQTIKEAAPGAEELISYQMPAYKYHGMLVYFAAYKNHIGFYPGKAAIEAFKKELSAYEGAVGTARFPIDAPLPLKLIARIVKFRVKQNEAKAKIKSTAKAKAKN